MPEPIVIGPVIKNPGKIVVKVGGDLDVSSNDPRVKIEKIKGR